MEEQGIVNYLTKQGYMIGLRNIGHQKPMNKLLQAHGILGWTTRTIFFAKLWYP